MFSDSENSDDSVEMMAKCPLCGMLQSLKWIERHAGTCQGISRKDEGPSKQIPSPAPAPDTKPASKFSSPSRLSLKKNRPTSPSSGLKDSSGSSRGMNLKYMREISTANKHLKIGADSLAEEKAQACIPRYEVKVVPLPQGQHKVSDHSSSSLLSERAERQDKRTPKRTLASCNSPLNTSGQPPFKVSGFLWETASVPSDSLRCSSSKKSVVLQEESIFKTEKEEHRSPLPDSGSETETDTEAQIWFDTSKPAQESEDSCEDDFGSRRARAPRAPGDDKKTNTTQTTVKKSSPVLSAECTTSDQLNATVPVQTQPLTSPQARAAPKTLLMSDTHTSQNSSTDTEIVEVVDFSEDTDVDCSDGEQHKPSDTESEKDGCSSIAPSKSKNSENILMNGEALKPETKLLEQDMQDLRKKDNDEEASTPEHSWKTENLDHAAPKSPIRISDTKLQAKKSVSGSKYIGSTHLRRVKTSEDPVDQCCSKFADDEKLSPKHIANCIEQLSPIDNTNDDEDLTPIDNTNWRGTENTISLKAKKKNAQDSDDIEDMSNTDPKSLIDPDRPRPFHPAVLHSDEFAIIALLTMDKYCAKINLKGRAFLEYHPKVRGNIKKEGKNAMYGSVFEPFVDAIIANTNMTKDDIFLDVGSGIGTVVMQVAATVGCKSMGIEIIAARANHASGICDELKNSVQAALGDPANGLFKLITLKEGDFKDYPEMILESTVIFLNNFGGWWRGDQSDPERHPNLELAFLNLATNCKKGTRIVCLEKLVDLTNKSDVASMKPHKCPSMSLSWTNADHDMYVYTIISNEWGCKQCTYKNHFSEDVCEMCGSKPSRSER